MNKHCKEGKTDLERALLTLISLLFLIPQPSGLWAQIPINGFCKYQSFASEKGLAGIYTLNFNGDSYTDIVLLNSSENKIAAMTGQSGEGFSKPVISRFPVKVSNILTVNKNNPSRTFNAFLSRPDRKIGVISFNSSGAARLSWELKLPSFPENLSSADIDGDGWEEVLVSGSSFDGLSVFKRASGKWSEYKVVSNRLFSQAVFTDLNHDGYADIAAIDLLKNSLRFFYNNSAGGFRDTREFSFSEKLGNLHVYDFDLDGYQDLIFTRGHDIYFMFGDAVSSFNRSLKVSPAGKPDNFIIADFNSDGYNDIAYLDKHKHILSVLFAKERFNFYSEVNYLDKYDLSDIKTFYSKFVNGIMTVSLKGNLFLVSNLTKISDNVKIALGLDPCSISYFDAGNDNIIDLCYYDRKKPSLNIIVRNPEAIPHIYYRIDLPGNFNSLAVDDKEAGRKTFYCFSKGKRLIEVVLVDFNSRTVKKERIYAPGSIADFKFIRQPGSERARLYLAFNRNGELGLAVYDYSNFRYRTSVSEHLASGTVDARLNMDAPLSVYYWQKEKNLLKFSQIKLNDALKPVEQDMKYSLPDKGDIKIVSFIGDLLNMDKNSAINFMQYRKNKFALVTSGPNNYKMNLNNSLRDINIGSNANLFFGQYRFNGLNKLFFFNPAHQSVERIDILEKKKIIISSRMVDSRNLGSYFVKNLNFKNYHLVYTDQAEKCITIREISW